MRDPVVLFSDAVVSWAIRLAPTLPRADRHRARRRLPSVVGAFLVAGWLAVGAAGAQSITVTTFDDRIDATDGVCSLREAVISVNADVAQDPTCGVVNTSGPDEVVLAAGTYRLTLGSAGEDLAREGDLDILRDVAIRGVSATATVIEASQADGFFDRLFDVTRSLTLEHLTLAGGWSDEDGGAIRLRDLGVLDARDNRWRQHHADRDGGALFVGPSTRATLHNIDMFRNRVKGSGGALFVAEGGQLMSGEQLDILWNEADGYGGGAAVLGVAEIDRSTIRWNRADSGGGVAVVGDGATAAVRTARIWQNSAFRGGAVLIDDGAGLDLESSSLLLNDAVDSGGGLAFWRASPSRLREVRIFRNRLGASGKLGSGLYAEGSEVEIRASSITYNHTDAETAAGLYVDSGAVRLENVTISQNTRGVDRIPDLATAGGPLTAVHSTLMGGVGGGSYRASIIERCGLADGAGFVFVSSMQGNLVADASRCKGFSSHDVVSPNLGLRPLATLGGTQVHPLMPTSPAVDAIPAADCRGLDGTPLSVDQRGGGRPKATPAEGCDVGAFELDPATTSDPSWPPNVQWPSFQAHFSLRSIGGYEALAQSWLGDLPRRVVATGNDLHPTIGVSAGLAPRVDLSLELGWGPARFDLAVGEGRRAGVEGDLFTVGLASRLYLADREVRLRPWLGVGIQGFAVDDLEVDELGAIDAENHFDWGSSVEVGIHWQLADRLALTAAGGYVNGPDAWQLGVGIRVPLVVCPSRR